MIGDTDTAARFTNWLGTLSSTTDSPLQVAYDVHGGTDLAECARTELYGYRGAVPVVFGNRAYKQKQLGSLGYVADCAFELLERGGTLRGESLELLKRMAAHVAQRWCEPDNGIWEFSFRADFVASKVMAWVELDRCIRISERLPFASDEQRGSWVEHRAAIEQVVLERGHSHRLKAFRQRLDSDDAIDAGTLLIPVMGMLPARDERVTNTVQAIVRTLSIDGFVYRFRPASTPGEGHLPVGQFEGAFLPCTLWLATTCAMGGELERAEELLANVERIGGRAGLLAEEYDPRSGEQLGNYPLLFAHVEHIRALVAIEEARRGQPSTALNCHE